MSELKPGDKAPEFTLKDSDGNDITLSEEIQKNQNIVLLFFPLAFSGVCTQEVCNMRDNLKKFEQLDAKIIGISVDSFFTLHEFKKANELNFTLASDFNRETAEKFGALYDFFFGMKGVAKRAAFVIDKSGAIQYAEVLEDAGTLPDFQGIEEALHQVA